MVSALSLLCVTIVCVMFCVCVMFTTSVYKIPHFLPITNKSTAQTCQLL